MSDSAGLGARSWARYVATALLLHVASLCSVIAAIRWIGQSSSPGTTNEIIVAHLLATAKPHAADTAPAPIPTPAPTVRNTQVAHPQNETQPPRRAIHPLRRDGGVLASSGGTSGAQHTLAPNNAPPPVSNVDATTPTIVSTTETQNTASDRNATPLEARQRWEARVLAHLDSLKQYPIWARFYGQEDVVSMRIQVARDGEIIAQQITLSHGYRLLDGEAIALLHRANPLPPPPDEVRDSELTFIVPIAFHIDRALPP